MPKAILEFQLPEEREEHHHALRGADYYSALSNLREWLRARDKHAKLSGAASKELGAVILAFYAETEGMWE